MYKYAPFGLQRTMWSIMCLLVIATVYDVEKERKTVKDQIKKEKKSRI